MDAATLAEALTLGDALDRLFAAGGYELLDHWQQGEFHHDTVLRVKGPLPGSIVIIATNCNGGVKEVLCFNEVPDRLALWHHRCPENPEFKGALPPLLDSATTVHWFNPCELLTDNTRSELREEHRERQCGGGWMAKKPS